MPNIESVLAYFTIELEKYSDRTRELIRQVVTENNPFRLPDGELEQVIRQLEERFSFTQDKGSAVKADYKPWLEGRRTEINFFYWSRLRKYFLEKNVLPPQVVSTFDTVTDELLDYCGDPFDSSPWKRRGMVMGHVQSGKTTNYASLICKAADVGYKIFRTPVSGQ